MTKRKFAAALLAVFLVTLIAVTWRDEPENTASQQQEVQPPRPSPIDKELARPPVKIVDERQSVRTRKIEPSFDNVAGSDWAVVAAIYKEYEAAERRAARISSASSFKPTVFPKKDRGSKYMVVLGSALTRSKAEELRAAAVEAGLPADTYVTKLKAE